MIHIENTLPCDTPDILYGMNLRLSRLTGPAEQFCGGFSLISRNSCGELITLLMTITQRALLLVFAPILELQSWPKNLEHLELPTICDAVCSLRSQKYNIER